MPLPGSIVDQQYRTEEINLRPGGSTITVTAPSDNPFELAADDIEIVTQDSGGMAGPDPRMRSKKLVYKGKVAHATKPKARHMNAGFLPGMGDGDEIELGAMGPVRKAAGIPHVKKSPKQVMVVHSGMMPRAKPRAKPQSFRGFLPGMGDWVGQERIAQAIRCRNGVDGLGATTAADQKAFDQLDQILANAKAQDQTEADAAAAKRLTAYADIAKSVSTAVSAAKQADSDKAKAQEVIAQSGSQSAQAAEATKRAQISADAAARAEAAADAAKKKAGMSTGAKIGIGAGVLVAAAVVAFLLLRKKG